MKRIYIAGPMTGKPGLNRAEFEKTWIKLRRKELWDAGIVVPPWVSDAEVWDESTSLKLIAAKLLDRLLECDAIYMLRGWEQSNGATAEHAVAKWIGLEIIYQGEAE